MMIIIISQIMYLSRVSGKNNKKIYKNMTFFSKKSAQHAPEHSFYSNIDQSSATLTVSKLSPFCFLRL